MQENERNRRYEGQKQHDYEVNSMKAYFKAFILKHKPIYAWHDIGLIEKGMKSCIELLLVES